MSNKKVPLNDRQLADLLAQGAYALYNFREKDYEEDSADFPRAIISRGINLFSFFYDRGKRLLICLGFTTKPQGRNILQDRMNYIIKRHAPFVLQISGGCYCLILNPSRSFLLSIGLLVLAINSDMPNVIYDFLSRILQIALGS